MMISVTDAAMSPKSVPYFELISFRSALMGYFVLSLMMIIWVNRSLYDQRKVKMPTVARDGFDSGNMILVKIWNEPHPSIKADSSRSFGTLSMMCL